MSDDIGDVSVDVTADLDSFEARLRARLKRLAAKLTADVKILANTKQATVELRTWIAAQARKAVRIDVEISKKGLATATAQLKALTGLSALKKIATDFNEAVLGFFTNLPAVASGVAKVGSIVSIVSVAVGSLAVSLSSLTPAVKGLGAVALALPGILTGFAATVATLVVAMNTVPDVVAEAATSFNGLKEIIGSNFWAAAAESTATFLSQLGPQIKVGMAAVASAVGTNVAGLMTALTKEFDDAVVSSIFDDIIAGAKALEPAMAPIATIIRNLVQFGTSLLPAISGWLTTVLTKFSNWLQIAMETGALNKMLADLWTWLQAVGTGLKALGDIVGGLATAALAAGIDGLSQGLKTMADIVNSPQFQGTLALFFSGAKQAVEGLLSALGPIGDMLTYLMPTISGFLGELGRTVGDLFGAIADAMATPIFQQGLGDFFSGILDFIRPLIAVMPQLIEKFGAFGTLAGSVLGMLGPVIASLLETLVPVLDTVLTALQPLVDVLGGALITVIEALGPPLQLIAQLFYFLIPALTPLIPMVVSLATTILDALVPVFTMLFPLIMDIVNAIVPLVGVILNALMPLIGPLVELIGITLQPVLQGLAIIFGVIAQAIQFLGPWLEFLATLVGAVIQTIVALFKGDFASIEGIWSGVWDALMNFWSSTIEPAFNAISNFFQLMWATFVMVFTTAVTYFTTAFNNFATWVSQAWQGLWNAVSSFFQRAWDTIVFILVNVIRRILDSFSSFVNWVSSTWQNLWNGVFSLLGNAWNGMISFISTALTVVSDTISTFAALIVGMWQNLWNGVFALVGGAWEGIIGFIGVAANVVGNAINSFANWVTGIWQNLWNGIGSFFGGVWDGIANVARGAMNGVLGTIEGFVNGAIRLINGLIGSINDVSGALSIPAIPRLGYVSLPRLAEGATVLPRRGGTAAILGEGGKAESVVDTGMMNKLLAIVIREFPRQVSAMRASVGSENGRGALQPVVAGNTYNNDLHVPEQSDPAQVAQEFVNRLAERVGL